MKVRILKTKAEQYFQTENLTREAFWNLYKPGCEEHLVLRNLRKTDCYIPELDIVALPEEEDEEKSEVVMGHAISTKAKVVSNDDEPVEREVLCLGPVSVSPDHQKKGVGSKLVEYSIQQATKLGYKGIILFGNPKYYHRFGFKNAKEFEITTKEGANFDPFMALELQKESLKEIKGKFHFSQAFIVDEKELEEYEKKFPVKEKKVTDTQL